jgi:NAD+-dependent secondary alcohol dehydrogenase Adh1
VRFVLGEITVAGNLIDTRADLEDLVMLTAHGKVVLRSTRYRLEAANDAIGDLRHGRIRGRAIFGPG